MTPHLAPAATEAALRSLLLPEEVYPSGEPRYGSWAALAARLSVHPQQVSRARKHGAAVSLLVAWGAARVVPS